MTKAKKKARTDMRTYLDIFRLKFERRMTDRRMTDRQIALTLNIGVNGQKWINFNGH